MADSLVVGLGELLWDMLPGGKQLGGAPANFAYISSLLGNRVAVVSRVGDDPLGQEALARLRSLGLSTTNVQVGRDHPTGTVMVQVDQYGQPEFTIIENVAWDHLAWGRELESLAREADVVCFGSLAQRSEVSRIAIRNFLAATRRECVRIFDVNLRQSFYSADVLTHSLKLATIVKLNDLELPKILHECGLPIARDEETGARMLLNTFGVSLVCVTRGARGSLLLNQRAKSEHPGFEVKVADTVGAGDAFTAAMADAIRRGLSLDEINARANRIGSWVASHPGATPVPKPGELEALLASATSAGASQS